MDSEDSFWNTMFEKELPKYKDQLDTIFQRRPLEISMLTLPLAMSLIICKIVLLASCVVDWKSLPTLGVPNVGDKV